MGAAGALRCLPAHQDALPDGKVVAPGRGVGNVAEIVARFGAQGGQVLSIEPHLAIFAGLSQLEREQRSIKEDVYPSSARRSTWR